MSISTQDLQVPFDPTGYGSITGAQLLQLLTGLYPNIGGLVIPTNDVAGVPNVPDASTTTKWKNYIWLRIGAAAVTPYIWNDNAASDATLLKWQTIASASIGVGTITNDMIKDNTILDAKIASLDYSKLTNAPNTVDQGDAAGGDLTGTYPNPTISNAAVTTAKIADLNVTNGKLENASATAGIDVPTKIKPSGSAKALVRTNAAGTAAEWMVPAVGVDKADCAGNSLKLLRANVGATDNEYVDAATAVGTVITDRTYTSTLTAFAVGTQINEAHGLGATPTSVRMVMVCQTAEFGYAIGDEVDISFFAQNSPEQHPCYVVGANATNVFGGPMANGSGYTLQIVKKDLTGLATITSANWKFKLVARL